MASSCRNSHTASQRIAPYVTIRSLRQLAYDHQLKLPLSGEITLRDFYNGDLLSGTDNVETAVIKLLKYYYFMGSNFLQEIPSSSQEHSLTVDIAVLGIYWAPTSNYLNRMLWQRSLLSEASMLFDPFGWITSGRAAKNDVSKVVDI